MKRRRLLTALGLGTVVAIGLYLFLPSLPSTTEADAIRRGMTLAEVEATLGQPAALFDIGAGLSLGFWELRDGWVEVAFNADKQVTTRETSMGSWFDRKHKRWRWWFGNW